MEDTSRGGSRRGPFGPPPGPPVPGYLAGLGMGAAPRALSIIWSRVRVAL